MDCGADDYLTKPFAMKELIARVNAATRRSNVYVSNELTFGDISLKSESLELSSSSTVRLSVKEFALIQTLILNKEHASTEEYLTGHIWPNDEKADMETLWLYISFLNKKLSFIGSKVSITGKKGNDYQLVYGA